MGRKEKGGGGILEEGRLNLDPKGKAHLDLVPDPNFRTLPSFQGVGKVDETEGGGP